MLVACGSSSEPGEPPAAGPGSLVAWSAESIRVIDLTDDDSSDGIQLDIGGDLVSQVTPSPDGHLAWTGIDGTDVRTTIGSLDGGDPEHVSVPTAPFYYAWNATGERLAFLGNDPEGAGVLFGSIDAPSGEARRHFVATPFFFDWSADGTRIVANVGATGLGRFDFPAGDLTDLGITPGAFPTPLWGSDRALVVTERSPTVGRPLVLVSSHVESEILSVDPGTGDRRVLAGVGAPTRLHGDPTGEMLAVVAGIPGDQTLSILNLATGDLVADRTADVFALVQWSPDGRSLLYTTGGPALTPRLWSRDSDEDRRFDAFRPSETFRGSYLPFWDQYDRSISLWASDSSRFALPTRDGIRVVSLDGDVRRIEDATMAVFAPEPGP